MGIRDKLTQGAPDPNDPGSPLSVGAQARRFEFKAETLRSKPIGDKMDGGEVEKLLNACASEDRQLRSLTETEVKGPVGPGGTVGLLLVFERPVNPVTLRAVITALLVCGLVAGFTGQADARKATPVEREAMLDVWNSYIESYLDDPPECRNTWVTRVSKYRPRTGMLWANFRLREARGCAVGDGWVLLRRPTPRSATWRIATQGSEYPPCTYVTPKMARELGFPTCTTA